MSGEPDGGLAARARTGEGEDVRATIRCALGLLALAALTAGCKKKADEVSVSADTPGAPSVAANAQTSAAASASAAATGAGADVGQEQQQGATGKLSPEVEQRFQKAMAEARVLHEKKDYAGALKGFQAALEIAPDDPRGLSELGWAAFFLNDLDLAEASTKKALDRATEAYLKASCYYNLGRIQEERGQRDEAAASYKKSLEFKMNTTVKERLAALDAAMAAAFEVLGVSTANGPFLSLDGFCEGLKKQALPEKLRCDPAPESLGDAYKGPTRVQKPGAPYLALRMIASARSPSPGGEPPEIGGGTTEYHIAVRTRVGWFVVQKAAATENPGADGITENLEVKELAVRDAIAGGAPEILFRATHYRGDSNMSVNELEEYTDESLTICGIGPSEKVSCTHPIRLSWSEHVGVISAGMDAPGAKHRLRDKKGSLALAFSSDGQIEIKAVDGELPDGMQGLPGKHALKFP